ncbi:MAG: 2OG-Fe(II) oxygenase, partial [Myxococcales bacterium]|nr:2OG-Fe(II) oxygenase [Myxococcales bacterium]
DALGAAGVDQRWERSGRVAEVPVAHDPALGDLAARVTALLGLPNGEGETFRLRVYGPGQGHPEHLDDYRIGAARLVATALLYLTDCDGGATVFPEAERAVAPQAGRLAVWLNVDGRGRPAAGSTHSAAPVVAGQKALLAWFVYATGPQVAAAVARGAGHIAALGAVEAADWQPGHTLTVVDHDVPEETIGLLEEACDARNLGFVVVDAPVLAPDQGPLPPGSLLYCAGTSAVAQEAFARLYGPGVATFHLDPRGPLWDCGQPDVALE